MDKIIKATGLTRLEVEMKVSEIGWRKAKTYLVLLANSRGKRLFFVSKHGKN